MKRLYFLVLIFITSGFSVSADELSTQKLMELQLVTPQNIDFAKCAKTYNFPVEKLFYTAILAINANNFEIKELQSKMGYILFHAVNKDFLISVIKIDENTSMLKVTPADNIYFFPYGIVYNINKYIELNSNVELKELE